MAKGTISDFKDLKDKLADRELKKQDSSVSHLKKTGFEPSLETSALVMAEAMILCDAADLNLLSLFNALNTVKMVQNQTPLKHTLLFWNNFSF